MPDPTPSQNPKTELTFRTRLVLTMCALVLLTGLAIMLVSDHGNRVSTQTMADSLFREVSSHAVSQTRDFVLRAGPVAQSLEQLSGRGLATDDLDRLAPQLIAFLKGNPGMTQILYADETGGYAGTFRQRDGSLHVQRSFIKEGKTHTTEYQVGTDGALKVIRQDDTSGYDPRARPFYILAKQKGTLAWTPPYMFFTQGLPGISCVVPVKNAQGAMQGVFSVEFDLNSLSQFTTRLSVSRHSRVFLFTPDQTLLAHPNQSTMAGKGVKGAGAMLTLADTGDPLVDAFRQHLAPKYLEPSMEDDFHFFEFTHHGVGYLASTTVFPIGGGQSWVVGAIAPESDFLWGVKRTRWLSLAAAAIALALAGVVAVILAGRISQPVQALITFTKQVGAGDLEARADFQATGEFRALSIALNNMIADLRERLHLRNSLKVAMDVQQSLLPASDPVSPLLDISGRSNYCDQTGGDYYDFIDISGISSCVLIAVGDVMGHGIPAALVMATARAALRTSALEDHSLAQLMTRTNKVLSVDNRHKRFMTLSLLMIDAQTRTVRWASAGHDPAIVFDPLADSFQELDGGDLPLGLMEDSSYEEFTSPKLAVNSILVIGTDGVWEMFNEEKKQYGKQRLQAVIRENHAKSAAEIGAIIEADLTAFRGLETPADDVTFVIVKFLPEPSAPGGGAQVSQS